MHMRRAVQIKALLVASTTRLYWSYNSRTLRIRRAHMGPWRVRFASN